MQIKDPLTLAQRNAASKAMSTRTNKRISLKKTIGMHIGPHLMVADMPQSDDLYALQSDLVMMTGVDADEFSAWLSLQLIQHPELALCIKDIVDGMPKHVEIDIHHELSKLGNLTTVLTDEMLSHIDKYYDDNYNKPPYLPNILGHHFDTILINLPDGLFFRCANVDTVRKIFRLYHYKVRDLETAGFIMRHSHYLGINPKNPKTVYRYGNLNDQQMAMARAQGIIIKPVRYVYGINLELHTAWYREQLVEYAQRVLARSTHDYPSERKSTKGVPHKKHREHRDHKEHLSGDERKKHATRSDSRLMWDSDLSQYITTHEYAERYSCTHATAKYHFNKLPYKLTIADLESGLTHDNTLGKAT